VPDDPTDPLQSLLGDLLKMVGTAPSGATAWLDAAKALAQGVATDNAPEPNADPLERIKIEELARVAELHVAEATGLTLGTGDGDVRVVPVTRGGWAIRTLDAWRPYLAAMVAAQEAMPKPEPPTEEDARGLSDLFGQIAATMGPVLLGLQFGSAAGHLAQRALGQYALPLPWPPSEEVLVIPQNIAVFASDWSLPPDETELWVCVRELTSYAILSRPHIARRIQTLLEAATADAVNIESSLVDRLEPGNPEALSELMADPESLLADLLTPGQRRTSEQLIALTTALGGAIDHVSTTIATSLTGAAGGLTEAWYRYRSQDAKGEQAAAALFGIDLGATQVERGAAFARGVVERAGADGLNRLWTDEQALPTPAEVDAPGLWLARIDLPDETDE
jgi:putative hydrolase